MRPVLPFLLLLAATATAQGGLEEGLKLYAEGKYDDAVAALRQAEAAHGDSPELQYDLALASWRAGDLEAARTAIEKYATFPRPRVDLHAGLLGAVCFDEARQLEASADAPAAAGAPSPANPLPVLEQALAKAKQAQDHFVRGAVAANSAELRRNAERALRYVAALQKKIDELKKQQQEQKQDDPKDDQKQDGDPKDGEKGDPQDQKQDGDKKDDKKDDKKSDPKDDPKGKPEQGQQDPDQPEPKPQQPSGEGQEGEPKPEPDPKEPEPQPANEPGADQPAPPRGDAPGEQQGQRELSPEQTQRLLELLQQLDGKLDGIRARAKSRRPKVEKDW